MTWSDESGPDSGLVFRRKSRKGDRPYHRLSSVQFEKYHKIQSLPEAAPRLHAVAWLQAHDRR